MVTEKSVYPCTIISDRYGGVYSKGAYTAWFLDWEHVPEDIDCDDISCMDFWRDNETIVGLGDTPNEALEDLILKLIANGHEVS